MTDEVDGPVEYRITKKISHEPNPKVGRRTSGASYPLNVGEPIINSNSIVGHTRSSVFDFKGILALDFLVPTFWFGSWLIFFIILY